MGVWVAREEIKDIRISSSCTLVGDVLLRHLIVADYCDVIEVSFSFFVVSCEKYL